MCIFNLFGKKLHPTVPRYANYQVQCVVWSNVLALFALAEINLLFQQATFQLQHIIGCRLILIFTLMMILGMTKKVIAIGNGSARLKYLRFWRF